MPTVTVLAPDSALAMDEVMHQLGADAYILSTTYKDGQVEIRATSDPLPAAKKGGAAPRFDDLLAAKTGIADTRVLNRRRESLPGVAASRPHFDDAPASDAAQDILAAVAKNNAPKDNVVQLHHEEAQAQMPKPENDTWPAVKTELEKAFEDSPIAIDTPQVIEPPVAAAAMPDEVFGAIDRLEGIVGQLVEQLKQPSAPAAQPVAQPVFPMDLAQKVLSKDPQNALDAQAILIAGPSGSGKSTLAAKMACLIKDMREGRVLHMVELTQDAPAIANPLKPLARVVGANATHSAISNLDENLAPKAGESYIFEAPSTDKGAAQSYAALRARFAADQIVVLLAVPAGLSKSHIKGIGQSYCGLDPHVVLCKLDECESSAEEISWISDAGLQIGWLSGTDMLKGTLSPAQQSVIQEFLDQHYQQAAQ